MDDWHPRDDFDDDPDDDDDGFAFECSGYYPDGKTF